MEELKVSGDVQPSDYETEEYLASLDPVLQRLNNDIPQAGYDRRSLSQLVVQLQQFMEIALGIKSIPPRLFPKIPAKVLRDSSPYGALYSIAIKCYEITKQRSLKKIDFANPAKRKENLEILSLVRRELQREGFIKVFKVHIHPSCQSGDMPRLQRIIAQLGSEIMTSEKTPGVTHIVYPFGPKGDPDDGQEYLRCLEKRGASSLVHYWYHPDSYDRCLPVEVAPEVVEPDKRIRGPWKVNPRWVLDSEKFNEWMNPVDYETEEAIAEQERLGLLIEGPSGDERGAKRRSDSGEGTEQAAKRQKQDQLKAGRRGDVEQGKGESVAPGVTKQRLVNADARWGDAGTTENLSQGQQRPSSLRGPGPKTPRAPLPPGDRPVSNGVPQEPHSTPQPDSMAQPQQVHRVPAYAAWFCHDRLHQLEVKGLPEYFQSSNPTKNPRIYKESRTLIIEKYRESTKQRLEFPAVQEAVAGSGISTDHEGLRRIYDFLDAWGLINYEASDGAGHSLDSLPPAVAASGLPGTVAPGRAEGPGGPTAVLSFNMPPARDLAAPAARSGNGLQPALTRRDASASAAPQPAVQEVRFFCNAMPWVDCTALRYHCTKLPDVDLCPEAFADGRFPAGCTARDFIKLTGARAPQESPQDWSDQETLLLLEGMEMYGENWAEIAEHVGTRSQVQCVMQFLRLPIEDDLAETNPQQPIGISVTGTGPVLGPSEQPIPFANTSNPIMAQLAFLATVVSPKVASAAAQRALEFLASEDVRTADLEDYLPMEEPSNGESGAVAVASQPAAATEEVAGSELGAASEPASPAGPAQAEGKDGDVKHGAPLKDEPVDQQGHAAGTSAASVSHGEANGTMPGRAPDTAMQEASEAPASEPAAAPEPAHASSAGIGAAKERDKPAAADTNGATPVSLTDEIPAEKLRMTAASALNAAAVKARLLADTEEQEARRLTLEATEALLQKVQRKTQLFEAVARALRSETTAVEAEGDRLTAERIMLHQSRADMAAQLARLKAIQAAAQGYQVPVSAPAPSQEAPVSTSGTAAPSSGSIPQASAAAHPTAGEGASATVGAAPGVQQGMTPPVSGMGTQAMIGEGASSVINDAPQQQQQQESSGSPMPMALP